MAFGGGEGWGGGGAGDLERGGGREVGGAVATSQQALRGSSSGWEEDFRGDLRSGGKQVGVRDATVQCCLVEMVLRTFVDVWISRKLE